MEDNQRMLLGPKGLIKRPEFERVIIQALHSLGYSRIAKNLELESGISHQPSTFASLKSKILDGNWDHCLGDHASFSAVLQENNCVLKMGEDDMEKLACFVTDFKKKHLNFDESFIPIWRQYLVEKLESLLPQEITMPERRLESLVESAIRAQINSCSYHNLADTISLLKDHRCCSRDQFPTKTVQVIWGHKDEVWFVKFSNNGKYLASSSKDCTARIWEFSEDWNLTLMHILIGHESPVSFVSWSPSDSMLLTCGQEVLKLWNVDTGNHMRTFVQFVPILSSCAWFPDETGIFYGKSMPRHFIFKLKFDDNRMNSFSVRVGHTIDDFALTPNGKYLIIISSAIHIQIINLETDKKRILTEESAIVSISISEDSEFLMVNLHNQEIHVWDVNEAMTTPFKYRGHQQARFVIRSCFGGFESMFIASGSEDSQVYIWNRKNENPMEVLAGHSKTVKCVSYNPKRPEMLASASDDLTIRIWGPSEISDKKQLGGSS